MIDGVVATAIVSAISAGALAGGTDAAKESIVDGYHGLKSLIKSRFGHTSGPAAALSNLQAEPDSVVKQSTLSQELAAVDADHDPHLISTAENLLALIKASSPSPSNQSVVGNYNAVADNNSKATVTILGKNLD